MRSVAPDRPGSGRQPEQFVRGEFEADKRQLGDDDRPHLPDGEGQQQAGNREPQIAPGDGAAGRLPEPLSSGRQSVSTLPDSAPTCSAPWIACISGNCGSCVERSGAGFAFHLADGKVHPHERAGDQDEQQHEAARPQPGEIDERAKGDGQNESAEAADHADEAADRADMARVIDRNMLEDGGLAERHEEAEHEDRHGEADEAHLQFESDRSLDAAHNVDRWAGRTE